MNDKTSDIAIEKPKAGKKTVAAEEVVPTAAKHVDNKDKVHYVGVDDGHYAVKICTEDGQTFSYPSRARQGRHVIDVSGDGSDFYETEEGQVFTVSEHLANYEDTRFAEYPKSALNRVLIHHALQRAGFGGMKVRVVTGLPVSYYYMGSGAKNETLIRGKTLNLTKGVKTGNTLMAKIVRNDVATEAIAAYFDMLMNIDGTESSICDELSEETVGVIDIGGKTTDCAVVYPGGQQVDSERSGSFDVGVLSLNDSVSGHLRVKFELDNVPPRMVESAIQTGMVKISGKMESVHELVTAEKEKLVDSIAAGIRTRIGSGKDLDSVIFVGGGAIVLRDQLDKLFKHSRFPENPEFANSRGMLKIAKYIFGTGDSDE